MFVGHPTNGITSMMLEQDEVGGERKRERERERERERGAIVTLP